MDKTIKIIEAVGNQWEFLLIFIVGTIFFAYRKPIGLFFSQIKKLKFAGQEVELEKTTTSLTQNSIQTPQIDENPVAETDVTAEDNTIVNLYFYYLKKDEEGAMKIFEAIQEGENDPVDKKKNIIRHLFIQFTTGFDYNAMNKLQLLLDELVDDEVKAFGYHRLGMCLQKSRNFDKAIIAFRKAENLGSVPVNKAESIVELSNCLFEEGQKNESLNCLLDALKKTSNNDSKSILYEALAAYYKKENNSLLASLSYEKALKLSPDNQELLFDTAYRYSTADIRVLSLLHYKTLISLNPNHSAALNNLGVCFESLKMRFKQIIHLKEATKSGNNLAAGNLAIKLIDAGFHDEAKEILDKAKLVDAPDSRVTSALSRLTNEIRDETEKEEKLVEIAKIQQRLFRNFPDEIFLKDLDSIDLNGKWKENDGAEISLTHNGSGINIEWLSEKDKYRKRAVKGHFTNKLVVKVEYTLPDVLSLSGYSVYRGLGVLNENFTKLHFALLGDNDYNILEFEFSKL